MTVQLPIGTINLLKFWRENIPNCGETLIREINDEKFNLTWKCLFNEKRMRRRSLSNNRLNKNCPFCITNQYSSNFIGWFNNIEVYANQYPIAPLHLLLFNSSHKVDPNITDFTNIIRFARRYPKMKVLVSNRVGSGASIPSHIHTHAFKLKLPIESSAITSSRTVGNLTISNINYPAWSLKICYKNLSLIAKLLHKIINDFSDTPFNITISSNSAYIIPRSIESPTACKGLVDGVGSLETAGIYTLVSKTALKQVNLSTFRKGLAEASFIKNVLFQEDFLNSCIRSAKFLTKGHRRN
jgi:hypothetical protein